MHDSIVAIVVEDGSMPDHVANAIGVVPITVGTVLSSMGLAGAFNLIGRTVFIEGAKLLSWGTGYSVNWQTRSTAWT